MLSLEAKGMEFKFCPMCGSRLEVLRVPFVRFVCRSCHRTHYANPKVGVALLIASGSNVLLVRRREPPFEGYWTLPSGYVEYEESCEEAAIREAREEIGVEAKLLHLLG